MKKYTFFVSCFVGFKDDDSQYSVLELEAYTDEEELYYSDIQKIQQAAKNICEKEKGVEVRTVIILNCVRTIND